MNNSKAGCSRSNKKLQMNKDLLKIRVFYNFDCIYHPFLLSVQIQLVIKSANRKRNIRNCSSHSSITTPLCFDHFYLVSIQTDPQDIVWLENRFVKTQQMLSEVLPFSTNLPFLLQRKVEGT